MGLPSLSLHWVESAVVRYGFPKRMSPAMPGLLQQPREVRMASFLASNERTRYIFQTTHTFAPTTRIKGLLRAGPCLGCEAAEKLPSACSQPSRRNRPTVHRDVVAGARRKPTDRQDEVAGRVSGKRPRAHQTVAGKELPGLSTSFAKGGPASGLRDIPRVGVCPRGVWIPGRSWVLI